MALLSYTWRSSADGVSALSKCKQIRTREVGIRNVAVCEFEQCPYLAQAPASMRCCRAGLYAPISAKISAAYLNQSNVIIRKQAKLFTRRPLVPLSSVNFIASQTTLPAHHLASNKQCLAANIVHWTA